MYLHPQRYAAVPWIWQSDLEEGPRAVWDVERRMNEDHLSCWQVPIHDEAGSTFGYLLLHAVRGNGNDGGAITLSISMTPRYDIYAKDSLSLIPAQSHPQRTYVYRSRWEQE